MPTAVVFFHSPQSFAQALLDYAQTERFAGFRPQQEKGKPKGLSYDHETCPGILFEIDRAKRYRAQDEKDLIQEMFLVDKSCEEAFAQLTSMGRDALRRHMSCQIIKHHKPKVTDFIRGRTAA